MDLGLCRIAPARIRYGVLLPPLLPLLLCAVLALRDPLELIAYARGASDWILQHFDWLFSWSCSAFLVLLGVVYLSPLGRTVIGGVGAERLLSPWRWFAITACTTIATGILFWGIAEPVYHVSAPPPAGGGGAGRVCPFHALSALDAHALRHLYGRRTALRPRLL